MRDRDTPTDEGRPTLTSPPDASTIALLLEHAPDHILLVNKQGRIEYLNYAWNGQSVEDSLGRHVLDYIPAEESRRRCTHALESVFGGSGPVSYEVSILLPGNEERWYQTRVSPVVVQGAIVGAAMIATDHTDRKRAELDLARTYQEFQQLIATIPLGIAITSNGRVLYLNHALAGALGRRESAKWNGHLLVDLFGEECRDAVDQLMRVDAAASQRPLEVCVPGPDGNSLCLELMPAGHMQYSGVGALLIIARDVTRTRVLQRQLMQAQRLEAIGQLAAGVAHEINTPIQYVGDNLAFLADAFRDVEALSEASLALAEKVQRGDVNADAGAQVIARAEGVDFAYLRQEIPRAAAQAREGVEQVARIVRAMKDFSHPGVDEPVEADINQALENTIAVARNEWKQVAELVTEFDAALPLVKCLPGDLNQAFLNIVINAAHAIGEVVKDSGAKGVITIRTLQHGDEIEVQVQDTGCGIPKSISHRVFDPFFTTKEVGKGTGQGLLIAHQVVVEKHEGKLYFESDSKGTVFHIRLPLRPLTPAVAETPQEAA